MLEVLHVRKEFTRVTAVRDISFAVRPGEVFGLIGPNGAGKSTTIRMVMDIIKPDAGSITVDGHAPGGAWRNMTGYLPEERGLYKKSRVDSVLAYFAALKGIPHADAFRMASPLLERFDLLRYQNSSVEELSKGNQQKLQFVTAVLHQPRLLVLDELFSGLDPVNQELMKDALLDLKQDNRAIVFSTHQMDHAEKLCDDLILINRGEVVLAGSPQQIKHERGHNTVRVEFRGDGAFLAELPGVQQADISGGFAELILHDSADSNSLLKSVLGRIEVSSFSRVEPSLHRIFIDTVGAPREISSSTPPPANRGRSGFDHRRIHRSALVLLLSFLLLLAAAAMKAAQTIIVAACIGVGVALVSFIRTSMRARVESRRSAQEDAA